jgi:hypothetical protein
MARRRVPERFPDDEIGWRDEQGRLVRCQPPVHLSARPLTWDEVIGLGASLAGARGCGAGLVGAS